MNIENQILPKRNELQRDEDGTYFTEILDAELDVVKVQFNYDRAATIDTTNLTYIVLTPENLSILSRLIAQTEKLYSEED